MLFGEKRVQLFVDIAPWLLFMTLILFFVTVLSQFSEK